MATSSIWKQLQRKVYIEATPDEVFEAVATGAGLIQWLAARVVFLAGDRALPGDTLPGAGNTFSWAWYSTGEGRAGRISSLSRNEYINFSFPDEKQAFSFHLEQWGERTLVTLTQQHTSTSEAKNRRAYLEGLASWTFFLANLKSVLEGGPDLRERENLSENELVNAKYPAGNDS